MVMSETLPTPARSQPFYNYSPTVWLKRNNWIRRTHRRLPDDARVPHQRVYWTEALGKWHHVDVVEYKPKISIFFSFVGTGGFQIQWGFYVIVRDLGLHACKWFVSAECWTCVPFFLLDPGRDEQNVVSRCTIWVPLPHPTFIISVTTLTYLIRSFKPWGTSRSAGLKMFLSWTHPSWKGSFRKYPNQSVDKLIFSAMKNTI